MNQRDHLGPATCVSELIDHWYGMAQMIEELGEIGEGGWIANKRVAATMRTNAEALRALAARNGLRWDLTQ